MNGDDYLCIQKELAFRKVVKERYNFCKLSLGGLGEIEGKTF